MANLAVVALALALVFSAATGTTQRRPQCSCNQLPPVGCAGTLVCVPKCSCSDAALCQPLSTPPPKREVFAFFTGNWSNLDFATMTTAAAFRAIDPQLVCHAHSLGVRVVRSAPFDVTQITNATARVAWVASSLASVKVSGIDGLNLDIEGYKGQPAPLTALVTELYIAMKAWNAHSQLSFDLSWSPDGQSAHYDHAALSKVLDFIVPMDYDEPWNTKVAAANSPIGNLAKGVAQYIKAGVPAEKLVIGLPWYGWDYPCDKGTPAPGCAVVVPEGQKWLGWATQVGYANVMKRLPAGAKPTTDAASDTKHFDYKVPTGKAKGRHSVWYDDPETLLRKYAECKKLGTHGVAFWTADMPDYATNEGTQMWAAVDRGFPDL